MLLMLLFLLPGDDDALFVLSVSNGDCTVLLVVAGYIRILQYGCVVHVLLKVVVLYVYI